MLRFRLRFLLLIVFCGFVAAFFISPYTKAYVVSTGDWQWSIEKPTIKTSIEVTDYQPPSCLGRLEMREVDGEIGQRKTCLWSGDKIELGNYILDSGYTLPAAKLPGDNKLHQIANLGCGWSYCLFIPATDTLILKGSPIASWLNALTVYKNVSQRLSPAPGGPIPSIVYNFDSSNPDYEFRSAPNTWGYTNGYY